MQKKKSNPTSKKQTKPVPKKTTPLKQNNPSSKKKQKTNKTKPVSAKLDKRENNQPEIKSNLEEKFLMVCGEPSGDLLGANLIDELKKTKGNFTFFGIGGSEMIKTGFTSHYDIESLAVIGFTGILTKYFPLKKIAKDLVNKAVENNVRYAILIDYPGFNLHLAEKLREKGIKIIFYVSPQIWAWRFKRIFRIRECVDLMLVLFPFEKKIYDEYNVNCEFVGHPLCSRMEEKVKSEKPISIEKKVTTICLMPGSRSGEITRLIDPLLETAKLIQNEMNFKKQKVQFVLPNINKFQEPFILEKLKNAKGIMNLDVKYFFDNTAKCLEVSDLVILSSGTATLEVTYFEKPMIIIYKMNYISFQIGLRLVTTKDVGLVNILAGERICQEFLQNEAYAENIFKEAMRILSDDEYRKNMINRIKQVKQSLGDGNAGKNAAEAILKLIRQS